MAALTAARVVTFGVFVGHWPFSFPSVVLIRSGTTCGTCSNGTTNVSYLDEKVAGCTAGLKYGMGLPPNVNCGTLSNNATCKASKCMGTMYTTNNCNQPNTVVNQ
jgi:hypothetical protein